MIIIATMHAHDETMLHTCIQGLRAPLWWPLVVSYSSATTMSPFKATWLSLKTQLKCCKLASMLVPLKVQWWQSSYKLIL